MVTSGDLPALGASSVLWFLVAAVGPLALLPVGRVVRDAVAAIWRRIRRRR